VIKVGKDIREARRKLIQKCCSVCIHTRSIKIRFSAGRRGYIAPGVLRARLWKRERRRGVFSTSSPEDSPCSSSSTSLSLSLSLSLALAHGLTGSRAHGLLSQDTPSSCRSPGAHRDRVKAVGWRIGRSLNVYPRCFLASPPLFYAFRLPRDLSPALPR
jgi:hypothetical protein